jgi:hypothetical protein
LLYNAMRKTTWAGANAVAGVAGYLVGSSIGGGSGHALLWGIVGGVAAVATVHSGSTQKAAAAPAVKPPEPGPSANPPQP